MNSSSTKLPPLESGLTAALAALEKQIGRELQRTPAQREVHGVTKWHPYQTRVERVSAFLLDYMNENSSNLDGLIVLSQAFAKSLSILSTELDVAGLGETRTSYVLDAFKKIVDDCERARAALRGSGEEPGDLNLN